MFLASSSEPGLCWPLLGLGVRFVQIVGAHRRSFLGHKPNPTKELWKRAFWCLVCIDTYMTSFTGRPRATNPSESVYEFHSLSFHLISVFVVTTSNFQRKLTTNFGFLLTPNRLSSSQLESLPDYRTGFIFSNCWKYLGPHSVP